MSGPSASNSVSSSPSGSTAPSSSSVSSSALPPASLHVYRSADGDPCAYADIPEATDGGVVWHRIPFGTALQQAESEARMIAERIGVALEIRDPLGLGSDAQVGDLGVLHPQDLNASNDD